MLSLLTNSPMELVIGFVVIGFVILILILNSKEYSPNRPCAMHQWIYKETTMVCNLCGKKPSLETEDG